MAKAKFDLTTISESEAKKAITATNKEAKSLSGIIRVINALWKTGNNQGYYLAFGRLGLEKTDFKNPNKINELWPESLKVDGKNAQWKKDVVTVFSPELAKNVPLLDAEGKKQYGTPYLAPYESNYTVVKIYEALKLGLAERGLYCMDKKRLLTSTERAELGDTRAFVTKLDGTTVEANKGAENDVPDLSKGVKDIVIEEPIVPENNVETETEVKTEAVTEVIPEPVTEIVPEEKKDLNPEEKQDVTPDVKSETKPEQKTDPKTDNKKGGKGGERSGKGVNTNTKPRNLAKMDLKKQLEEVA